MQWDCWYIVTTLMKSLSSKSRKKLGCSMHWSSRILGKCQFWMAPIPISKCYYAKSCISAASFKISRNYTMSNSPCIFCKLHRSRQIDFTEVRSMIRPICPKEFWLKIWNKIILCLNPVSEASKRLCEMGC